MGAEKSSKRSHDQIDADIEPYDSPQCSSERSHNQIDTENGVNKIPLQGIKSAHKSANAETEAGQSSQQATSRMPDQAEVETELGESSKRLRVDKRPSFEPLGVSYTQRRDSIYKATPTSAARDPTSNNHDCGHSLSEAIRPINLNFDQSPLLNPKFFLTRQTEHSPTQDLPPSHITSTPPSKPNPTPHPRPSFTQLTTDAQQGIKVLFLIDHFTKGDAIHHNLKPLIPPTSPEMKLLMTRCRSDRSSHQNRFFAKARFICAQLTSRRDFLELELESGEMETESSRADRRMAYFSARCTKAHLATVYSHIASAVDIPRILAARTPNERAFRDLMAQVFIHSMEDLWCFELHPSKRDLPAKREKANREDMYNRFKGLTDRITGLPAARALPGYLEVPIRADFPRYVLFGRDIRPGDEEDVYESDEDEDRGDQGDIPIRGSRQSEHLGTTGLEGTAPGRGHSM